MRRQLDRRRRCSPLALLVPSTRASFRPCPPTWASPRRPGWSCRRRTSRRTSALSPGQGGNAVDAAVATAFALAVTYPDRRQHRRRRLHDRAHARRATRRRSTIARRRLARRRRRCMSAQDGNIDRSLTAPGIWRRACRARCAAWRWRIRSSASSPWKDVVMPAAELAAKGFPMSASLARGLNAEVAGGPMKRFPASVAAYGKPGGGTWADGDRLVLPDLAKTLNAIANDGPDAFYTGWIADRIAEDMAANGGLITKADLAGYRRRSARRSGARSSATKSSRCRRRAPAASALIEDAQHARGARAFRRSRADSVEAMHLVAEAMRRAFLDRARFLGDPDFVQIPVARLTSKAHARDLAKTHSSLTRRRAAPSSARTSSPCRSAPSRTRRRTSRWSTRTAWPSRTPTRSKAATDRTSSSRARASCSTTRWATSTRSRARPNLTGDIGTPANLIAPGKRMLSSMTPTIVTQQRQGRARHRIARRPHDHQHRARTSCSTSRRGA